MLIQAGGFGEHQFIAASYNVRTSDYPGSSKIYAAPVLQTQPVTTDINDRHLKVILPPASEIVLDLAMECRVNQPTYAIS
mgnify:CR=1 FL=1